MSGGEREETETRERLFKALAHPIRLQTMRSLCAGPRAYTDLRKRVGSVAETPSASRGKFDYPLDVLVRSGLIDREDDAYALTDLGRQAVALSDAAAGDETAAREASRSEREKYFDATARAVRGFLGGTAGGALAVSFVLIAHVATRAEGASTAPAVIRRRPGTRSGAA